MGERVGLAFHRSNGAPRLGIPGGRGATGRQRRLRRVEQRFDLGNPDRPNRPGRPNRVFGAAHTESVFNRDTRNPGDRAPDAKEREGIAAGTVDATIDQELFQFSGPRSAQRAEPVARSATTNFNPQSRAGRKCQTCPIRPPSQHPGGEIASMQDQRHVGLRYFYTSRNQKSIRES